MSIYGIGQPMMNNGYPQTSHAGAAGSGAVMAANAAAEGGAKAGGTGGISGIGGNGGIGGIGPSADRPYTAAEMQALKRMGKVECQTCKNRTYQDGSDDPGVSFKAPGHIDPGSSAAMVMSHEQEHVVNEQAKANSEGRRIISQSVRIFMSACPECGRAYASGGVTRTVTAADNDKNSQAAQYSKSKIPSAGNRINSVV